MRAVCYLGTRGCPGVLEDALRDHFDALHVLVPAEPRLLGPLADRDLGQAPQQVAELLADRARGRAIELAERNADEQAGVFETTTDLGQRIRATTIAGPLEEALPGELASIEAEACFLSRDGLDVLAEAGIGLGGVFEAIEPELVTR
jgi:hypothetical protein